MADCSNTRQSHHLSMRNASFGAGRQPACCVDIRTTFSCCRWRWNLNANSSCHVCGLYLQSRCAVTFFLGNATGLWRLIEGINEGLWRLNEILSEGISHGLRWLRERISDTARNGASGHELVRTEWGIERRNKYKRGIERGNKGVIITIQQGNKWGIVTIERAEQKSSHGASQRAEDWCDIKHLRAEMKQSD